MNDTRQFRGSVVSVYKTIKEEIIDNILSGVFQPGDQIPTQEYYAEKYDVTRIVVRSAIRDLVAKELLITRKGKGTFVKDNYSNMLTPFQPTGFTEGVKNKEKLIASSLLLGIRVIPASVKVARYLAVEAGTPVVAIERVRLLSGKPISHEKAYIEQRRVLAVDFQAADLTTHSLYALLRENAGLIPCHSQEEIRAIACPQYQAQHLQIEEGSPVAYLKIRTMLEDRTTMAYSEVFQNTETVEIRVLTKQ